MRAKFMLAALGALLTLAPSMVYAQASIAGIVQDTSGAVLPGVTVEAASPVLIEGVRSAATDANGRYQVVNLRPGIYTVTFTLPGFVTVRQEGVRLEGAATMTISPSMRVGGIEETVTVTGESPVVDLTTTTRQDVLDTQTINALPTARNYLTLARLSPATTGGGNDVGGTVLQDVGGSVTIHGSRNQDQRVTLNGINTMTLQAGGNIGGQIPDVASAVQVTVEHTAVSAEMAPGGVRINFIPRDGGNRFAGAAFFSFANNAMQSSNFTDELKAAGLATPNQVKHNWDLNPALGGPILQDKLWFWFSSHFNGVQNYAPIFQNQNAYDPNAWLYVPSTQKAVSEGQTMQLSLRLTYQASPRNKIAGTYKMDKWCNCPNATVSATQSQEASTDRRFPRLRQEHLEWTSVVNSRLLFEAVGMHLFERWGNMHMRNGGWGGSIDTAAQGAAVPQMISVSEQSSGLLYRSQPTFNNTLVPNYAYRAAMTYVTGTHNFKAGVNNTHGFVEANTYNFQPYQYRFNNGVPNRVTIYATPYTARSEQNADVGLFAQDTWRRDRMTIGLALRFDYFKTGFPEQHLGPAPLVPNRDITFPAQDNLSWKDLTYRTSFSYDVRGDGKTALKVTLNKYLLGQTLNGLGSAPNPVNTHVNNTFRSWNDFTFPVGDPRRGNFAPDCNLTQVSGNGECGGLANPNFGTAVPGATYDSQLLTGFGHRPSNWEFSAGVQHELFRGVSVDVGYFRRIWQNFQVTDNLNLTANDFDFFNMVVPTDPKLPNGGGYTLTGIPALKTTSFGRATNNFNTLDRNYGKQTEHYNGVDVTVNARLQNGLLVSGGMSTGKTSENNCEIVDDVTEALQVGGAWQPVSFCDRVTPWLTNVKGYAIYTIPTIDVQLAGTYRNVPGSSVSPSFTATNAYLTANSNLGRPLAGGASNMSIRLFKQNTEYLDRRNELDLRVGKVLRFGPTESTVSFDIYNALNANTVLGENTNYSAFRVPTQIIVARFAKISWQFDF